MNLVQTLDRPPPLLATMWNYSFFANLGGGLAACHPPSRKKALRYQSKNHPRFLTASNPEQIPASLDLPQNDPTQAQILHGSKDGRCVPVVFGRGALAMPKAAHSQIKDVF